MNLFGKLFTLKPKAQSADGFVYVPDENDGPMKEAREGAVVRIEGRGPPWIVVDQELASIVVSKWPGRLWRVRIVEAATASDQRNVGGPPLPHARYTRTISVRILHEEAPEVMFGPHGTDIALVLKTAAQLDNQLAQALSSNRHPDAPRAYDLAWRTWMKGRAIPDEDYDQLDGTLKLGSGTWSSPINEGFCVLHTVVFDRARNQDGPAAIEDDGEDVWLVAPWSGADRALGDAALALGAPELVSEADRAVLLQAWNRVFT